MDGHYKLLEWCIKNNKTDVELTYNTNLSTLKYKNYDVFDLWKKFDTINLWPSVDGYKNIVNMVEQILIGMFLKIIY